MLKLLRSLLFLVFIQVSLTASSQIIIQPVGPSAICSGNAVLLKVNGEDSGGQYKWYKDGTFLPAETAAELTVSSPGSYHVEVIKDETVRESDPVEVKESIPPNTDFTFTNDNQCAGTEIKFTAADHIPGNKYLWDFGDGKTSTEVSPAHRYDAIGCGIQKYTITLIITDPNNCTYTKTKELIVKKLPDVQLADKNIFSPFSNCENSPTKANPNYTLTVNNISPSAGCITSYSIDWGDGTIQTSLSSTDFPLIHTYTELGEFDLKVSAIDAEGCTNSKTYPVANQSNPGGGLGTLGATTNLCAPASVPFVISGWQNNSPGTKYILNYGDGKVDILNHPLNSTATDHLVNHTYTTSSCPQPTFTASLTVVNACDETPYTAGNIQIRINPKADFTINKNPNCINTAVQFINKTVSGSYGNTCSGLTEYQWDFGDPHSSNNTSTAEHPTHTYSKPGTYIVTLTSSNPCGQTVEKKEICIVEPLTPDFSVDKESGCVNLEVNAVSNVIKSQDCDLVSINWSVSFTPSSCGGSASWSYINGTNASSSNPSFIFRTPGTYTIKQTITNECGSYINQRNVIVTAPPQVTINPILGNCAPLTFVPQANVVNCGNSALSYAWSFPGADITSFTDKDPPAITYSTPGTYIITLAVTNECGTTTATRSITVTAPPNVNPISNISLCKGSGSPPISFGNAANNNSVNYKWTNSNPLIGLTSSGTGRSLPSFTAQNNTPNPITAVITVVPVLNGCDGTPISFEITVNPATPAADAGSDRKLCSASTIQLAASDPGPWQGRWTLTSGQSGISFDDDTKANAVISGLQPDQTYIFRWTVSGMGPCSSTFDEVTIINRPAVTAANAGGDLVFCDRNSTNHSHILNGNLIRSFETGSWSILSQPAGSNALLTDPSLRNTTISGLTAGTYRLKWVVKNDICPDTSEDEIKLEVFDAPEAGNINGPSSVCTGGGFTLVYSGGKGKVINWQESDNNTVWTDRAETAATLSISNYTQKKWFRLKIGSENAGCGTVVYTNSIAVEADPLSVGGIVNGETIHCSPLNSGTLTLTGHTGAVIRWETSNDGIVYQPDSRTTTSFPYNNLSQTTYYRAVVRSGDCDMAYSEAAKITVNPAAVNAAAGPDQVLCNESSVILNGNSPGATSARWTLVSGPTGISFDDETNPKASVSGLQPGETYVFRWTIEGHAPCPPTFDEVTITNRPPLTTASAGSDAVFCDRSNVNNFYTLHASPIKAFETGTWTISSQPAGSNAFFADPALPNTRIIGLTAGTYRLKWSVRNDVCTMESEDEIELQVYEKPEAGLISGPVNTCFDGSFNLNYTEVSGKIVNWQESDDNFNWRELAETSAVLSVSNYTQKKWFRVKLRSEGVSCNTIIFSQAVSVNIDPVSVGGIATGAITVCIGTNSGTLSVNGETGSVIRWQKSTDGSNWQDISGSAAKQFHFSNLTETTHFRAVVKSGVCSEIYSSPVEVTVLPQVDISDAGSAIYLCNVNGLISLDANTPLNGTGKWIQKSGPAAVFEDINDPKTKVTITQLGDYTFEWEISNGICPPSSSQVKIHNYPSLSNTIAAVSSTYCFGQQAQVSGSVPTGGNGIYTYTWETSINGNVWSVLPNETNKDLSFTASETIYVRRTVTAGPCTLTSSSILITVLPPIINNTISEDQEVCIGKSIQQLSGSVPSGGNETFSYQWQQSADGISWQNITGALSQDYQPLNLSSTTYYQRLVTSAMCTDAQKSISNTIKVIINPNAKADFTAAALTNCAPFDLSSVITGVPYPDRNASYEWFADGISIGTGINFPGYTLAADGDKVDIKLKAYSRFECEDDEMTLSFSTVKNVSPSFSKDQTEGCGPLTAVFTNNSSPIEGASYLWDFGNGETSTLAQPLPVVFQPHPLHRDTTYIITLKAVTACQTTVFIDSIKVRPKPLAVFSPDKTIGCSPFEVNFTNQSKGMPNTYTFDFGNGDKIIKNDNLPFSYTFHTVKTDTFTVKLYAQNECGIDSSSYDIVVYPNTITPELVINGSSSYGCTPFTVKFDNNFEGANSFHWDFGDGTTAVSSTSPASMQHTFTQPGTYVVKLTGSNGCASAVTTETIVVYPKPSVDFSTDKLQYCIDEKVVFSNLSAGSYTYIWDFGDGIAVNQVNPQHAFQRSGLFTVRLTAQQTFPDGTTCSSSISKQIEVLPQPAALFTSNAALLNCAPFTFIANALPASASGGVEWHFDDPGSVQNTAHGYRVSHVFNEPGLYQVKAIAYNQNGCADSVIQLVRVTASPVASFTPQQTMVCGPAASLKFDNLTTYTGAGTLSYKWYVNDVFISTQKDLIHNFLVPSNESFPYIFRVKLIAQSTIGCADTTEQNIQFNPLPKADFITAKTIDCAPHIVAITNKSTYADAFKWYLDGVLVSTEKEPVDIALLLPDRTYQLKLIAANRYGCTVDSMERSIRTYAKPKAVFTVSDSIGCTGFLEVKTTNISAGAVSYTWDFGDGTPVSHAVSPSHIYPSPGVYTLKLTAFNGFCTDTSTSVIKVAPAPKASFTSDITEGCTKAVVAFRNLSDHAVSYLWDFGDGTYSAEQHPSHSFSYINSPYTVKLIAFGEHGCTDTVSVNSYISIAKPPAAAFDVLPDSIIKMPDYTFHFKNRSSADAVNFKWDFGNGKTSFEENPSYTYPDTGKYKVQLIAYNQEGCQDTLHKTVWVQGVPGYIFVPNAFEPGSGSRDLRTFKIKGSGIAEYSIRIFNKWGELIWQSSQLDADGVPSESWDGTIGGEPALQGVYIWEIKAKFINGTEWKGMKYQHGSTRNTGPVHLIR